jgi:hypothetical protein
MGLRAKWTLKLEKLRTHLANAHGGGQPLLVSLEVNGLAGATPSSAGDCLDIEPICGWITHAWPQLPPQPLLQARTNELLEYVFSLDQRVQDVRVGLYRTAPGAALIGIERHVTRRQFEDQRRAAARPVRVKARSPLATRSPSQQPPPDAAAGS